MTRRRGSASARVRLRCRVSKGAYRTFTPTRAAGRPSRRRSSATVAARRRASPATTSQSVQVDLEGHLAAVSARHPRGGVDRRGVDPAAQAPQPRADLGPDLVGQRRGVRGGRAGRRSRCRGRPAAAPSSRRSPTAPWSADRPSPRPSRRWSADRALAACRSRRDLGLQLVVADPDGALQPRRVQYGGLDRRASASGSSVSAPRNASSHPITSTTTGNARSTAMTSALAAS